MWLFGLSLLPPRVVLRFLRRIPITFITPRGINRYLCWVCHHRNSARNENAANSSNSHLPRSTERELWGGDEVTKILGTCLILCQQNQLKTDQILPALLRSMKKLDNGNVSTPKDGWNDVVGTSTLMKTATAAIWIMTIFLIDAFLRSFRWWRRRKAAVVVVFVDDVGIAEGEGMGGGGGGEHFLHHDVQCNAPSYDSGLHNAGCSSDGNRQCIAFEKIRRL